MSGGPVRFIPAYAGFWLACVRVCVRVWVHPRLRGVLRKRVGNDALVNGSSPLTRGSGHLKMSPKISERFIPAYAGFWLESS